MKTYPYIVINKGNMSKLEHFKTAEQVALHLYPKTNSSITDNFIIVKDENRVVDLKSIKFYTALPASVTNLLVVLLEDA